MLSGLRNSDSPQWSLGKNPAELLPPAYLCAQHLGHISAVLAVGFAFKDFQQ